MMIVKDDSEVINKLEASLADGARVVTYNRHIFIVQASGLNFLHKVMTFLQSRRDRYFYWGLCYKT
jgi:hypothetical protein